MHHRHQLSQSISRDGRYSRRVIVFSAVGLGAAAVLGGAVTTSVDPAVAQQGAPASTIEQFYLALTTYRYTDAYALLGRDLQATQSLDAFTKGYADTAFVQAEITGTADSDGQSDIEVDITSWHNDRSIHVYGGSYRLNQVEGDWKIAAASIEEATRPQGVAPLMRFSDLDVTFGTHGGVGLGHRYFQLLITNTTQDTVMAAGVPQLTLLDRSDSVVLESSSGQVQPITAVAVQPEGSASATFEWTTWCTEAPASPLRLQIAIPGDTHELIIPFSEPLGLDQDPPCVGSEEVTIFLSQAFQAK